MQVVLGIVVYEPIIYPIICHIWYPSLMRLLCEISGYYMVHGVRVPQGRVLHGGHNGKLYLLMRAAM